MDGWTDGQRRTPDHGYTIISPCESIDSGELELKINPDGPKTHSPNDNDGKYIC